MNRKESGTVICFFFVGSNIEELKYPQPIPDQNSEKNSRATSPSINSAILDNDEEFEEKDEAMAIFFLEILVRITILNKDRVNEIWPSVEDHMKKIIEVRSNPLKVSKFQNEFMKSSFLPKYDQKNVRISALHTKGQKS